MTNKRYINMAIDLITIQLAQPCKAFNDIESLAKRVICPGVVYMDSLVTQPVQMVYYKRESSEKLTDTVYSPYFQIVVIKYIY